VHFCKNNPLPPKSTRCVLFYWLALSVARKTLCCSWALSINFLFFFLFLLSFAFGVLFPAMGEGEKKLRDFRKVFYSRKSKQKTLRVLHKAHLENITYGKNSLKEKIVHINFDGIIII
jgi:hypothetical protein